MLDSSADEAYSTLSTVLRDRAGLVVEFEILPTGFGPSAVVVDGPHVGLTKSALIKAVPGARHHLLARGEDAGLPHRDVLLASQVLLLFDCEHLTAANLRKRHLAGLTSEEHDVLREIRHELALLDSFLTSRLHRHTKSPTLWSHRRWMLFDLYPGTGGYESRLDPKSLAFYEAELTVVTKAGDRHPRNYYAWAYARSVICLLERQDLPEEAIRSIVSRCVDVVHAWCLRHASDTSGWSFLIHLLGRCGLPSERRYAVVQDTLTYALDFHWDHESVWVFLRTVLASDNVLPASQRKILTAVIQARLAQRPGTVSAEDPQGRGAEGRPSHVGFGDAGGFAPTVVDLASPGGSGSRTTVHMCGAVPWIKRFWTPDASDELVQ
ncbi:MAG: hypothetical protein M1832_000064 [Thelocarpon impressellum]|nr:MAG: hypothetical protein M1832_000064 [Thelocarpon impressellum]